MSQVIDPFVKNLRQDINNRILPGILRDFVAATKNHLTQRLHEKGLHVVPVEEAIGDKRGSLILMIQLGSGPGMVTPSEADEYQKIIDETWELVKNRSSMMGLLNTIGVK